MKAQFVYENLDFNREGTPLDKIGIGEKNIIEVNGVTGPSGPITDDVIKDLFSDWANLSGGNIVFDTNKGKLSPEDMDEKIAKYAGEYYQLPKVERYYYGGGVSSSLRIFPGSYVGGGKTN